MGGGSDSSGAIRQQEALRQARITQGLGSIDQAFAGFTPDFYQQRARDYTKFATPQLAQQAQQTWRGLTSRLAGQGLLKSSAAGRLGSSLKLAQGQQQQALADEAQNQAQSLQKNVEGQRQNMVAQLESSADPYATSKLALGSAASLSGPSTFAPIGNLFQNWSNMYLASQMSQQNPIGAASYLTRPSLFGSGGGGNSFNLVN